MQDGFYRERRLTTVLTYAGGLPFAGSALMVVLGLQPERFLLTFLAYGAVIAGFMAGTLWGQVQAVAVDSRRLLLISNLAALIAFAALIQTIGPRFGLVLQALAFLVLLGADWSIWRAGRQPDWYWTLRRNITAIVLACFAVLVVFA